jgi:hypothetical protein
MVGDETCPQYLRKRRIWAVKELRVDEHLRIRGRTLVHGRCVIPCRRLDPLLVS